VIPIVKRQARRFAVIGQKTLERGASIKFYGAGAWLLGNDKVPVFSGGMK